MADWFYLVNDKQQGPFPKAQIIALLKAGKINRDAYVYTAGMSDWAFLKDVPELRAESAALPQPPSAPRPSPVPSSGGGAHKIDYKIVGDEMQFVEIELDPQESAVAEAGAMMYMSETIKMSAVFGDGSGQDQGGFMGKLLGAGKRLLTGESLFITVFTHEGSSGKAHVALAAPNPGKIIPLNLAELGGKLICQKDAFLAAAKGVSIGIHFQKKIGVGLFGGEGFIMQKLEGDGWVFIHAGGTIVEKTLAAGQLLRVDTGCLVAMEPSVQFDIEFVGGLKSAVFGGEGVFFAVLRGPGRVWIQSLPFARLAGRIHAMGSRIGGRGGSADEGSILGGVGGLIGGD
jgi:uncharacterized protein (TIGR00266 family)